MSGLVLVLLGLVLCFAGALSVRLTVLVAGFSVGWLLAETFGASLGTQLVVSLVSAAAALLVTVLLATVVLFVAGATVGAVVGARLFSLTATGEPGSEWLLAVVFVPTVAVVAGLLADRFRRRFLVWGTALAGASLVLGGLGRIGRTETEGLWRPESAGAALVAGALWVGLTLLGRRVQRDPAPDD